MDMVFVEQAKDDYPIERNFDSASYERVVADAMLLKCTVVMPTDSELQIDIDSLDAVDRFLDLFELYRKVLDPDAYIKDSWKSRSGNGRHFVINTSRSFTPLERHGLQAMLGSDEKRELLGFARGLAVKGIQCCLYRPKGRE